MALRRLWRSCARVDLPLGFLESLRASEAALVFTGTELGPEVSASTDVDKRGLHKIFEVDLRG